MPRRWFVFLVPVILLGSVISACSSPTMADLPWEITPTSTAIPLHVATITPQPQPTAVATATALVTPTATPNPINQAPYIYYTQAGDTLPALAVRFGVSQEDIRANQPLPSNGLLSPNTMLVIPRRLWNTTSSTRLIPDSEIVYSPSAIDFDILGFVAQTDGYLASYKEYLIATGTISGSQIVAYIARNNSINPRLLLALLEYRGHWVYGDSPTPLLEEYPLGYTNARYKRLYRQLAWAVNQLSVGYYGWREGLLTEITFRDGSSARLAPDLNAGTVALAYFFAQVSANSTEWLQAMDANTGFPAFYAQMFGDPWARAYTVEPLYPPDLTQPPMILPIQRGAPWFFTGGPHGAWEHDGARAALDFAPGSASGGCGVSRRWAVAVAPGVVVRSEHGVVVLDLDGDGKEQTGWNVLYLHMADDGRVPVGAQLNIGDRVGHPSCEGGTATGTHVHIARKYNGEWIAADGPVPFVMDGWLPHAGEKPYEGTLTKGDKVVFACPCGSTRQIIFQSDYEP